MNSATDWRPFSSTKRCFADYSVAWQAVRRDSAGVNRRWSLDRGTAVH